MYSIDYVFIVKKNFFSVKFYIFYAREENRHLNRVNGLTLRTIYYVYTIRISFSLQFEKYLLGSIYLLDRKLLFRSQKYIF